MTADDSEYNPAMSKKENNREAHLEPPPGTHCCYYCHFLCLWKLQDETDLELGYPQEPPRAMSEDLRYRCLLGCSITNEVDSLVPACSKEHWNSGDYRSDKETDIPTILKKDRADDHCYYQYNPNMGFSKASELHADEAARQEIKKDRRITVMSIVVGAIIALIGIGVGIIIALTSQ